jgi:hypothetical protein
MPVLRQRVFGFHWTKDPIHLSIVHRGGSQTPFPPIPASKHMLELLALLKFSPKASGICCDMILMSMLPNLLMGMMSHLQAKEGQTQDQK